MFDIDFSSGQILGRKGQTYQRPGEVLFKRDGAKAQSQRQTGQSESDPSGLDGPEALALHRRLLGVYRYELERQYSNRLDMAMDEDMFDHIQWTAEELATLAERGQSPIVFNLIQTTINWVLGSQRRATTD